jgi:NAD(P)H-dependent FMN reductase
MSDGAPRIAIISGSQRPNSQSAKVARFMQGLLAQKEVAGTWVLELGETPLELWTDDPADQEEQTRSWKPISEVLRNSEALVIVTPEWNGMVPPALKNFFLYCTEYEIADKPAMIVGVSSGRGGSTPAAELRASSYKDTRVCYVPEQVIISRVTSVLNTPADGDPESEADAYIRFRLNHALDVLIGYARALTQFRQSGVRNFDQVPFGM